jgi:phospholipid/cholesterol/gamma-HCH transport system substrate-binding protein
MRRPGVTGPLIKSIIFILVTALATAILGISIANTTVTATTGYRAIFTDVTGLIAGSDVDIAGVKVGQVTSVSVYDRDLAAVNFTVDSDQSLPASVTATILYLNLVGARYIELAAGTGPVGQSLPAGGTIPLARTTPALDLTELFNGFQPLYQALSPGDVNQLSSAIIQVFQGEGPNIDTLAAMIGSLTSTLASRGRVIDELVTNLGSVLGTVSARDGELRGMVVALQQFVSALATDNQPIGDTITAISRLTSVSAQLLQVGRAPLEQDIVQLGRLASVLNAGSPQVRSFLQTVPSKLTSIARLASYGSWVNFYLCSATVSGVHSAGGGPDPTGLPVTAARCA